MGRGKRAAGLRRESPSRDCSFRIPSFRLRFRKCYDGLSQNSRWCRGMGNTLRTCTSAPKSGSSGALKARGSRDRPAASQEAQHRHASHGSQGSNSALNHELASESCPQKVFSRLAIIIQGVACWPTAHQDVLPGSDGGCLSGWMKKFRIFL